MASDDEQRRYVVCVRGNTLKGPNITYLEDDDITMIRGEGSRGELERLVQEQGAQVLATATGDESYHSLQQGAWIEAVNKVYDWKR